MKKLLLTLAVFLGSISFVYANELDNEPVNNKGIQGTIIIRVDQRNQETSIVKSDTHFDNNQQAQQAALTSQFAKLDTQKVRKELDNDGGASSWYWYFPGYYYSYAPTLAWYGYYYTPCYTYSYNYYNYYYYSNYYAYSYWR